MGYPPGYPPRSPTSSSFMPECHKLSYHCLTLCYNDTYDGAQLVHILSFDYVFRPTLWEVETHNITIDIPSMDKSRNIFHEILRVSTPIRLTKLNMLSRNLKIFRFSTPHKEWPNHPYKKWPQHYPQTVAGLHHQSPASDLLLWPTGQQPRPFFCRTCSFYLSGDWLSKYSTLLPQ